MDPIVQNVIEKFKQRSEVGKKKYNTTLEQNNAPFLDWVVHMQEELMDAILYLEKLKTVGPSDQKSTSSTIPQIHSDKPQGT
jgi:hypothetical protein